MRTTRKILITEASGYVGGRLARALVDENFDVRILVRNHNKIKGQPWAPKVEIKAGSAENRKDLEAALLEVHTAYYLLHAINLAPNFDEIKINMMQKFAKLSGLKKRWIIKFPGLTPGLSSLWMGLATAVPTALWQKAQGDSVWVGEMVLKDRREATTDISVDKIWRQIEGIGGEHGWFGFNFLWRGLGLGGQLNWYAVPPFHLFVFPTMLRNIIKKAA